MAEQQPIPGVKTLTPRVRTVKALQYTGKNHNDISLFVPLNFRSFVGAPPGQEDLLMVQTCDGARVVYPGMYIIFGLYANKVGYHVMTEEEIHDIFEDITKDGSVVTSLEPVHNPEPARNWPFPTGSKPKPKGA